jgi:hypothetical protein
VINYRFGGLAEKILETHQIVLVKRTKDRVRYEKTQVGFMWERWDFRRGFYTDWSRHKTDLKITWKARGLFALIFFNLQLGTDISFSGT